MVSLNVLFSLNLTSSLLDGFVMSSDLLISLNIKIGAREEQLYFSHWFDHGDDAFSFQFDAVFFRNSLV